MGKTITTYLIDGDPNGAQYLFISNKICKMVIVPRANLSIINERDELNTPAFYILLGENDAMSPEAYIGETESFKERVKDHDYKKDFWQKALIFISKDGAMTKADVQYLEHRAFAEAKRANRYSLGNNKQTPKAPNLPEHQKDSMDEFFEDIKFLTSFVGCNIFEVVEEKEKHIFNLKGRGCKARGFYDGSGFTVLKGSVITKNSVPSLVVAKFKREALLKELKPNDNGDIVLDTDKTFSSPSSAAIFCMGSNANGWIVWKDSDGMTLDEVYRKNI
ncbi:MAG: GIY-YIG nuclease family protein [Rikenellaceae bacterium]